MQWSSSSLTTTVALLAATLGCTESGISDAGGAGGAGGPGSQGPDATVYLDQYGIPHIECATDEDCATALGYQHAFDRFAQMDLRRRVPTGRLTGILDKGVAQLFEVPAVDAQNRALYSTREGQPVEDVLLAHLSEKTLGLLEAYSVGVNRWIDDVRSGDNGAVFPRELQNPLLAYAPARVPEWTPRDSIAVTLAIVESLTNREGAEVAAGAARDAIDDDAKFFDWWGVHPVIKSSILSAGWQPPTSKSASFVRDDAETPRKHLEAGLALRRLRDRQEQTAAFQRMLGSGPSAASAGSNNWVVAPSRTANGHALLANDPHLPLTQPALWYLAHLDAKTHGAGEIHAAGATLAGLPMVIVGQNETLAWGATTAFFDLADVYVEEIVEGEGGVPVGVMFEGRMVPFTRVPFTVRFSDETEDEHEMLFVPHHGPIRGEIDLENGVALTLRWTLHDATTDINALTELDRAADVEEARTALESSTTMGISWVFADRDGDIAFFPYTRVPSRTWATNLDGEASPWLPLDGRGNYEWKEYWGYAELPQVVNPEAGFIATANNDMTGHLFDGDVTNDGYPPLQAHGASGFRHARIVEMIEEMGDQHTVDTMLRIQHDDYGILAENMAPGFVERASSSEVTLSDRAQTVLGVLSDWGFTCPTGLDGPYMDSQMSSDPVERSEAVGCAAFHAVLYWCANPVYRNEHAPSGGSPAYYYSLADPTQLAAGDVYWDDPGTPEVETYVEVIEECFDEAARRLIEDRGLGEDETEWLWGRAQGLQLFSDFASFEIHDYDNPQPGRTLFTSGGGFETVNPNLPGYDWIQTDGASVRFVCEVLPSEPECVIQLPGGQSNDINSENYQDLLLKWLDHEPIELTFDIDEAKEKAVRTVSFD